MNLDVVHAYKNNAPAKPGYQVERPGPSDGDLVFVTGHPVRRQRAGSASEAPAISYLVHAYRLRTLEARR